MAPAEHNLGTIVAAALAEDTGGRDLTADAVVPQGTAARARIVLYDAILIKENHIALAGGLEQAVAAARATAMPVEVECRDLDEVGRALESGAERLLLDNMSAAQIRAAVALRAETRSEAVLEASGGVSLETIAEIAAAGPDCVSVGALTHSAPALDLSMMLE